MSGRPVDVVDDPKTTRRTVYGLVDRQSLPAVFRAFDFASPDLSSERRPRTTVPQQALFSMNSPLVIEQAKALAARPEIADWLIFRGQDPRTLPPRLRPASRPGRARRPPCDFLTPDRGTQNTSPTRSKLTPIEQLAQVLLMANELMFVD